MPEPCFGLAFCSTFLRNVSLAVKQWEQIVKQTLIVLKQIMLLAAELIHHFNPGYARTFFSYLAET